MNYELFHQAQKAARSLEEDYEEVVKILEAEVAQLRSQLNRQEVFFSIFQKSNSGHFEKYIFRTFKDSLKPNLETFVLLIKTFYEMEQSFKEVLEILVVSTSV